MASLIGVIAASVFVWVNVGTLPSESKISSIIFWIILLAATVYFVWIRRSPGSPTGRARPNAAIIYGISCGLMVVGFIVVSAILRGIGGEAAMPAAVAAIVGLHFLPFAHAFAAPFFARLGALMSLIGAIGVSLALLHGAPWGAGTAVTAGIVMLALQAFDAWRGLKRRNR